MPESVSLHGRVKVIYKAEHRSGICNKCNIQMELYDFTDREGNIVKRVRCTQCGDSIGQLISTSVSIQPPDPPQCLSFRCVTKFMRDSLYALLLSSYHHRRVAYAEANRHKTILERYRTGQPSPTNMWQVIHANIKLKCPVCRKYNVDPLLFRRT